VCVRVKHWKVTFIWPLVALKRTKECGQDSGILPQSLQKGNRPNPVRPISDFKATDCTVINHAGLVNFMAICHRAINLINILASSLFYTFLWSLTSAGSCL
jgi:hypothetical protein